jgi:hypothetical protein
MLVALLEVGLLIVAMKVAQRRGHTALMSEDEPRLEVSMSVDRPEVLPTVEALAERASQPVYSLVPWPIDILGAPIFHIYTAGPLPESWIIGSSLGGRSFSVSGSKLRSGWLTIDTVSARDSHYLERQFDVGDLRLVAQGRGVSKNDFEGLVDALRRV